ncbi:MAG: hypothetical protein RQM92_13035 [Candidatus Syntrophopropionicum ammoniitolerans]
MTTLPMILVLLGVPLALGYMNRRHADQVEFGDYRYFQIKDLSSIRAGEPVRIRGTIKTTSLKWLNRPNFRVSDDTGEIGVFMFWAPREDINPGDKVEAAGYSYGWVSQKAEHLGDQNGKNTCQIKLSIRKQERGGIAIGILFMRRNY